MLNTSIQQRILSVLGGYVLSTSMVARKSKLSRITVSKYLGAMEGKHMVQAVRVGKAVAWRQTENKPLIAILANTGTARVVKLSLGDKYNYMLVTNATSLRDAFVLITDSAQQVKVANIPVVLIGSQDEQAYALPALFDTRVLKVLVKKIYLEQAAPHVQASAAIVIEDLEQFEEAAGIHKADELLKLTSRLLRENKIQHRQYERSTFLIDGELPEGSLVDIEQTFHVILAHIYGRMVTPGDTITVHGVEHTVPTLTITLHTELADEVESLRH